MMITLLQTKFHIPQLRSQLVTRPNLITKLDASLNKRLSLVSAPVGFGKTTLITQWYAQLRDMDCQLVWLSLDTNDNDLSTFLSYLITTLQQINPQWGEDILKMVQESPFLGAEYITTLINDMVSHQRKFILVLDDYHIIDNKTIHGIVSFLLEHIPEQMHLVIMTRADPPLPLARLRIRNQITEIRTSDLSFTEAEVSIFLNQIMQLNLTNEDILALESRTEGWIASLQLAVLALAKLDNEAEERHQFIVNFSGNNRYIVDILVEEIFAHQPKYIYDFLLYTSILDELNVSLCDSMLQLDDLSDERQSINARYILDYLDRSNLFLVPLDNTQTWYRYHHLFKDLLSHHLQKDYPHKITALHNQASLWYEENRHIELAIRHALVANDYERVANLIEQSAHDLFSAGKLFVLKTWLDKLPESLLQNHPSLYILQGWILFRVGNYEGLQTHLHTQPHISDEGLRGELLFLEAQVAYFQGNFKESIYLATKASHAVPADNNFIQMPILTLKAWCFEATGDLDKTLDLLKRLARMSMKIDTTTGTITTLGQLIQIYAYQGKSQQAVLVFDDLMQFVDTRKASHLPLLGMGYFGIGLVFQQQRQFNKSSSFFEKSIHLLRQWGGLIVYTLKAYLSLILVRQEHGQIEQAQKAFNEALYYAEKYHAPLWALEQFKADYTKMMNVALKMDSLTKRELDVLKLLIDRLSSPQIAEKMGVSVSTIRSHIKSIYRKLGVHSRDAVIVKAKQLNLL